jgi:hypothetical protein
MILLRIICASLNKLIINKLIKTFVIYDMKLTSFVYLRTVDNKAHLFHPQWHPEQAQASLLFVGTKQ